MTRDQTYLKDILRAARLVRAATIDIDRSEFESDWMRLSAVAYQLEIVGEAAKRITEEMKRQHPEIQWRKMTGMRDVLIHAYSELDIDEVWNTAQKDIPNLIKLIEPLVEAED